MSDDPERYKRMRVSGLYTMIPIVMFVTPIVGWGIGRLLQTQFGLGSWVVVLFSLLGCGAAVLEIVRIIRKASEEDA